MALYLEPNSGEWLSVLEVFNPEQAARTRRILKRTGRTDVCSICGDQPASDFKIVAEIIPANAVATIRLCRDCREIRGKVYGEIYEPLRE